jgi:hypothetical protein
MKSLRCAFLTAFTVVCLAAPARANWLPAPTDDVTAATRLNPTQLDCFKQYGGYQNPQTGQWMMSGTETVMFTAIDAVYRCVAQRTGRPVIPFLHENIYYR